MICTVSRNFYHLTKKGVTLGIRGFLNSWPDIILWSLTRSWASLTDHAHPGLTAPQTSTTHATSSHQPRHSEFARRKFWNLHFERIVCSRTIFQLPVVRSGRSCRGNPRKLSWLWRVYTNSLVTWYLLFYWYAIKKFHNLYFYIPLSYKSCDFFMLQNVTSLQWRLDSSATMFWTFSSLLRALMWSSNEALFPNVSYSCFC